MNCNKLIKSPRAYSVIIRNVKTEKRRDKGQNTIDCKKEREGEREREGQRESEARTIFEFCSRFNSQRNRGRNGLEVCRSESCVIKSNSLDSRPYHRAFRSYGRTQARESFDRSSSFENYGLLFSHPVLSCNQVPLLLPLPTSIFHPFIIIRLSFVSRPRSHRGR